MLEELDIKVIQKYKKYRIAELRKIATRYFNKFIRERDADKPCVSCKKYKVLQAGHFYSAGHYPALEYNEKNVHGQCVQCNMHEHGNLNLYRKNIVSRIGQDGLDELDNIADYYRKHGWKHDRFYLIGIIEKYKNYAN